MTPLPPIRIEVPAVLYFEADEGQADLTCIVIEVKIPPRPEMLAAQAAAMDPFDGADPCDSTCSGGSGGSFCITPDLRIVEEPARWEVAG